MPKRKTQLTLGDATKRRSTESGMSPRGRLQSLIPSPSAAQRSSPSAPQQQTSSIISDTMHQTPLFSGSPAPTGSSRTLSNTAPVISEVDAPVIAQKLLDGDATPYKLLSVQEMNRSLSKERHKRVLTSPTYEHFYFIAHEARNFYSCNPSAGWVLCREVETGGCSIARGLMRFVPSTGNSSMKKHADRHEASAKKSTVVKAPMEIKRHVSKACVYAVTLGDLPFNFVEKKEGMKCFTQAIFDAGRCIPGDVDIDVEDLLPCATTVRSAIQESANDLRLKLRGVLPTAIRVGGAVSSDGLTNKISGKKYYDFVLHFVDPRNGKHNELTTIVLFLAPAHGGERGADIRELLRRHLYQTTGYDFDSFVRNFSLVTDSAAVMPTIVGASVSENISARDERWLPCVAHMLNTAMKHAMKALSDNTDEPFAASVTKDIQAMKKVIAWMKRTGKNSELPRGFALMQEIDTRFGTIHDITERFIRSAQYLPSLLESNGLTAFDSITSRIGADGTTSFPYLQAVVTCFKGIRHAQTALEAAEVPTLPLVLPLLDNIKSRLGSLSRGGISLDHDCPEETSRMAGILLPHMEAIKVHDLWIAACLLHPGMRDLAFMQPGTNTVSFKTRGKDLIRKMMEALRRFDSEGDITDGANTADNESREPPPYTTNLGEDPLNVGQFLTFVVSQDNDELGRYLVDTVSSDVISYLKNDKLGLLRYWNEVKIRYRFLSRVARRILATPASSSGSERHFSHVNRLVSPIRSQLGDDIIADLTFLKSMLKDFSYRDYLRETRE